MVGYSPQAHKELYITEVTYHRKEANILLHFGFGHSVVSDSLWAHGLQHAMLAYPSPTPGVYSDLRPLSQWRHPTILSIVEPFTSHLQCFSASGLFQWVSGQRFGDSASVSVLPMHIQDWFPLGLTGWISLKSQGLSRVFSNTTVQKHQFFSAHLSLYSNSYIHTWLLEKL